MIRKRLTPKTDRFITGLLPVLCLLPLWLWATPSDGIESVVGPLTWEQQHWLNRQPALKTALVEIAEKSDWTDKQGANALFDHVTTETNPILSAGQLSLEIAILKALHPDWSMTKVVFTATWKVSTRQAHTILDLVGLIPALGEGADLVNGVFYLLEGDKANAAFSFAAMVPFVGWVSTGAKYAGKIVKTATGYTAELKFVVNSNGVVSFGNRSQLTRVIGKKAGHQVHHIIPWGLNNHRVIQKAADSGDWHPNLAKNGINLNLSVHNSFLTRKEHKIYNDRVEATLNDIFDRYEGLSPTAAARELENLANQIRLQLGQNKRLDQIAL